MTLAATIDTLAYAKRLIDAGVPQKQAEAQAEILSEIIEEKLATKPELSIETHSIKESIARLEEKIEHRFSELDAKIGLKNAELKNEIIKWVIGISAGQAALIVSLLKFFH